MFSLKFDTGNAAFADGFGPTEAARILRKVAHAVEIGAVEGGITDANGNKVGAWDVEFTANEGEE